MVDVEKRIKSAASQAVSYRNYRRARDRALVRLANAHLDEYKDYLQEEKAKDEQENKKWLDIAGNTSSATEPNLQAVHKGGDSQAYPNKSNDGGEA